MRADVALALYLNVDFSQTKEEESRKPNHLGQ